MGIKGCYYVMDIEENSTKRSIESLKRKRTTMKNQIKRNGRS